MTDIRDDLNSPEIISDADSEESNKSKDAIVDSIAEHSAEFKLCRDVR